MHRRYSETKSDFDAADASEYQKWVAKVNIANAELGTFEFLRAIEIADQTLLLLKSSEHGFLIKYLFHIKSQAYAFLQEREKFLHFSKLVFSDLTAPAEGHSISSDIFEFHRGRYVGECVLELEHQTDSENLKAWATQLHEYHALTEINVMAAWNVNLPNLLKANLLNPTGRFLQRRTEFLKSNQITKPGKIEITEKHLLGFAGPTTRKRTVINLNQLNASLKAGQIPHRLFFHFLCNPGRRFAVVELYQEIYPTHRYFRPSESPNLIHQAVKRLNYLLKLEKLPFQIVSQLDRYLLSASENFSIHIENRNAQVPAFINLCQFYFSKKAFRTSELSEELQITSRQIQNLIRQHASFFSVVRSGRNLYYSLKA